MDETRFNVYLELALQASGVDPEAHGRLEAPPPGPGAPQALADLPDATRAQLQQLWGEE